ncbi:hypothetical protein ACFSFY_13615 [Sporosarcina siberiensis]|uniref:ABC-2 type transport system permease protein n=1 Tax=Sporosarcina siberiensis TaxID=1365606 RepID=A0ABW4SHU9_9BACL
MSIIIWSDIRKFTSHFFFLTIAVVLLVSFSTRQVTTESYEHFLLRIVSDQYYLLYFMTPLFLLNIYKNLDIGLPIVIFRFKTFSNYFFTKSVAILINTALFVFVQILVICLIGIGLHSNNHFSISDNSADILFLEFAKHFSTPLTAISVSILFMILGLSFLGFMMQILHHFFGKRMLIFLIMGSYLLMILVFKYPSLSNLSFITINRFFIFHHNFHAPYAWIWTISSILGLGISAVLVIKNYWNHSVRININFQLQGLFFYFSRMLWKPKNIGISLLILLLIYTWNSATYPTQTIEDTFLLFFYGQELGQFHLMTFIEQLVYNGTPLYLIAVFTEQMQRSSRLTLWVRIQYKSNWFRAVLGNSLLFLTCYLLLTLFIIILLGMLNNQGWNDVTQLMNPASPENWMFKLFALKFLEFCVYYFGFLFLFLKTRNVTIAFLIVFASHLLLLIPLQFLHYFPIGLGTLARVNLIVGSNGIPFIHAIAILTGCTLILYSLCYASYKRFLLKEM